MGEAAKAGTLLNFAVGGEGRGYTDAAGTFIPRRRPRPEFPHIRQRARGRKLPPPGRLLRIGRLDALDSVALEQV